MSRKVSGITVRDKDGMTFFTCGGVRWAIESYKGRLRLLSYAGKDYDNPEGIFATEVEAVAYARGWCNGFGHGYGAAESDYNPSVDERRRVRGLPPM